MKNYKIMATRLDPELYQQIKEVAKKQDRSFGNMIRVMIKYYLNNLNEGNA